MQNSNQNQPRIIRNNSNNNYNNHNNQSQNGNYSQNGQNYNRSANQNQHNANVSNVINPVITHQGNLQGAYLQEVTAFASYVKFQKLITDKLTIKDAIEIILVADRLQVARLDALKSWQLNQGNVVISAHFILNVFIAHRLIIANRVKINHYTSQEPFCLVYLTDREETTAAQAWHKEKVNNPTWQNPNYAVEELALIRSLRKAFPTLMMGIICPVEIEPSFVAKMKDFSISTVVSAYSQVRKFLSSCITLSSGADKKLIAKTKELVANDTSEQDDFFLDLDELELKPLKPLKSQKAKPTTQLNHLN